MSRYRRTAHARDENEACNCLNLSAFCYACRVRALLPFTFAMLAAGAAGAQPATRVLETQRVPNIFQFGIALAGKFALGSPFCHSGATCVLGSGGGIAARFGHVFQNHWYVGGGYDFSKHDSSQLYRLAILQQVRIEGRYLYPLSKSWLLVPFSAAGLAGYGNEWSVHTWGPALTLGVAVEAHVGGSVVGLGLSWQGMYLQRFSDPGHDGAFFAAGVPQFMSLELRLEATERF